MDSTPPIDQSTTLTAEEPRELCANCGKKMAKKGKFCPHCGQKRFEGRVPLKELTSKFLYKATNLDSKLLRMMWRLLIPAQVTLDYFSGKIKQYPHPFQFFFVVMFFFLLAYTKLGDTSNSGIQFNLIGDDPNTSRNANGSKKTVQEDQQSNFYFLLERYVFSREIETGYDSLPPALQTPAVKESLKILLDKTHGKWPKQMEDIIRENKTKDSLAVNAGSRMV